MGQERPSVDGGGAHGIKGRPQQEGIGAVRAGLLCCLLLLQPAYAQQLKREVITAAYIFNFANNIEWHNEARIPEFHFLVISDDDAINREMRKMAASKKLKGKPIRITVTGTMVIPKDIQLVFVARGLKDLAVPVFRKIEGQNILMVTEGFEDKRLVMINLVRTKDKTIKFEINKANIINQGLKVLPDMVLLGGTEIDVAQLYKESQDTLRKKDVKIADLQKLLDSINVQIGIARKEIDRQNLLLARQGQDILAQQDQLMKQRDTLSQQTALLSESQRTLKRQRSEIESGREVLSDQMERIESQNASILEQQRVLDEQDIIIGVQRNIQRFLILVIVLALGLSYSIYRGYKSKQLSNRLLHEQRDKLQEMLGQLKIARDKAQQYLDIAGVIFVAIDTDGRITMINGKGCEVLGRAMDDIIGKNWFESFIPESIRPDIVRAFHRFVAGETGTFGYSEHLVQTRGRGERLIAWQNVLLRDEAGRIAGTLASGEDITEKKLIEKQIKRLNQELLERAAALEAANKELEAFSYSVSHDLRAPLRSIDGFSQAIIEDYEDKIDDRGKDYLRRVRTAAQRMALLIDDMLNLSRVTRNEMAMQEINLSDMAAEIAEKLRRQQPGREAEFVIQPGVIAWGDEHLIRIALENLFDNAWKYTSKHPAARIEFGSRVSGRKRVCFVRDDGAGFDMKYAQKLFGAFQRMHTAEEFPGTGVGLATVQRIIHRHGGAIWAESEVEKGATFFFSIPEKEE
jgi:PAS domain S-box-containing protein